MNPLIKSIDTKSVDSGHSVRITLRDGTVKIGAKVFDTLKQAEGAADSLAKISPKCSREEILKLI